MKNASKSGFMSPVQSRKVAVLRIPYALPQAPTITGGGCCFPNWRAVAYLIQGDVFGRVHTHSRYATAFAAMEQPISCALTAMADEFGGPILCGGFALIGGEEIGQEVIRTLKGSRSPVALMQNHSVFAIGKRAKATVKAAVMTEDVATTPAPWARVAPPTPRSQPSLRRAGSADRGDARCQPGAGAQMIGPYQTAHAFRAALEERLKRIAYERHTDLMRLRRQGR